MQYWISPRRADISNRVNKISLKIRRSLKKYPRFTMWFSTDNLEIQRFTNSCKSDTPWYDNIPPQILKYIINLY